ncbi:MAG: cell filamentation protein Fic [Proteobacteria bacterium]|nr:cell filamentation protein Fic [Pseudomonadota bacterium]
MAELFGVKVPAVNKHLKNIFASGELVEDSVISILETTATDGKSYQTRYYNLDAVIAVGYRINSVKATQFRIWATHTLREFIVKGFVVNDEQRAYQKIADVFEQCSSDYQSDGQETQLFFQIVQNQLHFATSGKTAAEIVYERADSEMPFMGLSTWKNSPKGKILKSDVTVAKNYLNQGEVSKLNLLVIMFIDFAELRALNRQVMTMQEWVKQVIRFLDFNEQQVLEHSGKISREMAQTKAHAEFEKFRIKQDQEYLSDFDQTLVRYLKGGPVK